MIRKIIIGLNPKDAMAYFVGMSAGGGKVVAIQKDEDSRLDSIYKIFIESEDGTILWKEITNLPTIIEYDCKF